MLLPVTTLQDAQADLLLPLLKVVEQLGGMDVIPVETGCAMIHEVTDEISRAADPLGLRSIGLAT